MSIETTITILKDEKYAKVSKKPIRLLFQKDLSLEKRKGFFNFLLGYFILVPSLIIQLLCIQEKTLLSTISTLILVTLLGLYSLKSLAIFTNHLLKEYRDALYKDSYDDKKISEVFTLFGAVLTRIRAFEKHKHTQESLVAHIVEELKLMRERKVKGIFAEMNKFLKRELNKNQ